MLMQFDAEKLDRFKADGFATFDTGLSPRELTHIRDTLLRLHSRNAGFNQGALFDAMGVDDGKSPKRFPQILQPSGFTPELLENDFFQIAAGIARQILGHEARFKADTSQMKPAWIGEATPWHQDEAFHDPAFEYHEISFWLALQSVDESNGCMAYVPGSHQGPVLPHGFPGGDHRIHALECSGTFDLQQAVSCPLPAGGCLVHTQRTVHGAGPNVSDEDQLAYVLTFELAPTPAPMPQNFPWRALHHTARAQREMEWRRRGGLVVQFWRQRVRLRLRKIRTLVSIARRAARRALHGSLTERQVRIR